MQTAFGGANDQVGAQNNAAAERREGWATGWPECLDPES